MFPETGQRVAWISHFQDTITKFENIHFLTTEQGRDCFQRTSWLLLGDSTTTELMHDIALLLSGTEEESEALNYYRAATKFPRNSIDTDETNAMVLAKSSPDRETTVRFCEDHRSMTITSDKIYLRHRFIGRRTLDSDKEGISALHWLLREDENMQRFVQEANAVLLNSAEHDCARNNYSPNPNWVSEYAQLLRECVRKNREFHPSIKTTYKGSSYATVSKAECVHLDVMPRHVMVEENVEFIETTCLVEDLYKALPELTSFGVHVGGIRVYSCDLKGKKCGGLVGKLQLQNTLNMICPSSVQV